MNPEHPQPPHPPMASPAASGAMVTLGVALGLAAQLLAFPVAAQDTRTAIQMDRFGGTEVLELHEIPRPDPGPDEMIVRVVAAGVNPVDWQIRSGQAASLVGAELPYIPGFDVSGVVEAVGSDVTRFAVGDEVFAHLDLRRGGAYATHAIVKEGEAAPLPDRASHVEAASLPLVALTAWQALFETAGLEEGQTVLIHAGAGGVGSIAVQLAKWRGARVIATASVYNHAFLREIGADVTVDYRTERFEDFAADVDVVLDPIGGDTQLRSMEILREGGTLVSIVGLTPEARDPERNIHVTSILVHPSAEQLGRIGSLVDEGHVRPIVTYRFPLSAAAAAHAQSETARTRGKIVLDVSPAP